MSRKVTTEDFVQRAKEIHGNKYSYSGVVYQKGHSKVRIICSEHGDFLQEPNAHLCGQGCPMCNLSKGELEISRVLDELRVRYEKQYRFSDCRNAKPLPFDFYLPDFNLCIEYDGEGHFRPVCFKTRMSKKKANKAFQKIKKHDKIKEAYCLTRHIGLLRIPYTQYSNIEPLVRSTLYV